LHLKKKAIGGFQKGAQNKLRSVSSSCRQQGHSLEEEKKKVQCIDARHRRGFPGKSGASAAGLMSRLLPKGRQVGTQRY